MKALLPFAMLAVLLSGCVAGAARVEPAPIPDGADSDRSAFDVSCGDLVPLDELVELWGEDVGPLPFPTASAAGSWEMQGTALLQDGALACTWGTSPSERPGLIVLGLADARDGFERSEESFTDGPFPYSRAYVGDSSATLCRSDNADAGIQCHWNVLAGDTWLSFFFQHLPESELTETGVAYRDGVSGAIVASVIEALSTVGQRPTEKPESAVAACDARLTADLVARVLGVDPASVLIESGRPVEESLGRSTPLFGQVMWAYAFERQGYEECMFVTEGSSAGTVITAPGAAWVLQRPGSDQPELVEIDGLGEGVDTCRTDGDYVLCTRAVAVGNDLVLVQLEDDETGAGSEWAALFVDALIAP